MYLKSNIWNLEGEAQINKIEIGKSAAVTAKVQKELDIAKFQAGKLSGVVNNLQRRLDRLEDLMCSGSEWRSNGSNQPLPLESSSDDSWGPGPDPGRSCGRIKAPRSDHARSTRGSARRSDLVPPRRSSEVERDERLSADYHRWREPLHTSVQPEPPRQAREPAPRAYGRYGALRDEVPEEDMDMTSRVPMETPWRTSGSAHPGDQPAGAAGNTRRRSTWKAYVDESLEEWTWRSGGAAAWGSRRKWTWQRREPTGADGGNLS